MRGRVIIRIGLSAMVALLLMASSAFAQSPADTVYNNSNGQVLGVVKGGGNGSKPSGPSGVAGQGAGPSTPATHESGAGTPATTATATSGSSLPFTGFQAGLVALAGAALLGTGFAMRRVARHDA